MSVELRTPGSLDLKQQSPTPQFMMHRGGAERVPTPTYPPYPGKPAEFFISRKWGKATDIAGIERRIAFESSTLGSFARAVMFEGTSADELRITIEITSKKLFQTYFSSLRLSPSAQVDFEKRTVVVSSSQDLDWVRAFLQSNTFELGDAALVTNLLTAKSWRQVESAMSAPTRPVPENKAPPALPSTPPPMPRPPAYPPRPTENKGFPTPTYPAYPTTYPTYPERSGDTKGDTKYEFDSKHGGDLKEGRFGYQPHPPPRRPERHAPTPPVAPFAPPPAAPTTPRASLLPAASSAYAHALPHNAAPSSPRAAQPTPRPPLTFAEQLAIFKRILPSVTPVNPIHRIGDVLRGSIIVETPEQVASLIEEIGAQIEAEGGSYYVKNFWSDPKPLSKGYVGAHMRARICVNPEAPEHLRRYINVEIQFHLKDIMDGRKGCAKEVAHLVYKQEAGQDIASDLTSASQLLYLTAMRRRFCTQQELEVATHTLRVIQEMTHASQESRLRMEAALYIGKGEFGVPQWNEQYQVLVPGNKEAVTREWMCMAEKINRKIDLRPDLPTDKNVDLDAFTNTATTEQQLYADARPVAPRFRNMCETAARKFPGCYANFGPEDEKGRDCMLKEPKSLQAKIQADNVEEFGRLMTKFLEKIGSTLPQITGSHAVRLKDITAAQNLNFSGCPITDDDLLILELFPQLQSLNLAGCMNLTDAGLARLAKLTGLRSLNLSGCQITAAGLAHLWPLTELKSINLVGCDGVSDDDLARVGLQGLNLAAANRPRSRSPRPLAAVGRAQAAQERSDAFEEVDG